MKTDMRNRRLCIEVFLFALLVSVFGHGGSVHAEEVEGAFTIVSDAGHDLEKSSADVSKVSASEQTPPTKTSDESHSTNNQTTDNSGNSEDKTTQADDLKTGKVPKADAGNQELTNLFGADLEETASILGLDEETWYMMVDVRGGGNGNISVAQIWDCAGINKIWLSGTDQYTLDGINPLMERDEIIGVLRKKGYQETIQEDVWRRDSYFFDLSTDNGFNKNQTISLEVIRPLAQEGRTEVSGYIGKRMSEAVKDFGGDAAIINDVYYLKRDDIWFRGKTLDGSFPDLNETDNIVIAQVEIFGLDTPYCIYGIVPGMTEDMVGKIGMEEGGSGELVDPMINTIFWGEAAYGGNERLTIFNSSFLASSVSNEAEKIEPSIYESEHDLTRYIGNDYAALLEERDDIAILEEREDEIKLGNDNLSVSARKDNRVITRVGIRNGSDYTAEEIGVGVDIEAAEQKLQERGYVTSDVRLEDDRSISWIIYENMERELFFAIRNVRHTCDAIYYGMKVYMPF